MIEYELSVVGDEGDEENIEYLHGDFNSALAMAGGEFIVFLSLGDRSKKLRYSRQISTIRSGEYEVCFCSADADDGEDFSASGLVGVIPPATVAVANLCLSAAMFKTEFLRKSLGGEKISADNPYFWLRALRDARCVALEETLLSVENRDNASFRELFGTPEQSRFHPLIKYYHEFRRIKDKGIYKIYRKITGK